MWLWKFGSQTLAVSFSYRNFISCFVGEDLFLNNKYSSPTNLIKETALTVYRRWSSSCVLFMAEESWLYDGRTHPADSCNYSPFYLVWSSFILLCTMCLSRLIPFLLHIRLKYYKIHAYILLKSFNLIGDFKSRNTLILYFKSRESRSQNNFRTRCPY